MTAKRYKFKMNEEVYVDKNKKKGVITKVGTFTEGPKLKMYMVRILKFGPSSTPVPRFEDELEKRNDDS